MRARVRCADRAVPRETWTARCVAFAGSPGGALRPCFTGNIASPPPAAQAPTLRRVKRRGTLCAVVDFHRASVGRSRARPNYVPRGTEFEIISDTKGGLRVRLYD